MIRVDTYYDVPDMGPEWSGHHVYLMAAGVYMRLWWLKLVFYVAVDCNMGVARGGSGVPGPQSENWKILSKLEMG